MSASPDAIAAQELLELRRKKLEADQKAVAWERRRRNAESLERRAATIKDCFWWLKGRPVYVAPAFYEGAKIWKRSIRRARGGHGPVWMTSRELPLSPSAIALYRLLLTCLVMGKPALKASALEVAHLLHGRATNRKGETTAHATARTVFAAMAELEAANLARRCHTFHLAYDLDRTGSSRRQWQGPNLLMLTAGGQELGRRARALQRAGLDAARVLGRVWSPPPMKKAPPNGDRIDVEIRNGAKVGPSAPGTMDGSPPRPPPAARDPAGYEGAGAGRGGRGGLRDELEEVLARLAGRLRD